MGELSGQVAIVTGASRGIGRGAAIALAEQGAAVVVASRSVNALAETVAAIEAIGGNALAVPCDVASADDISRCVASAVETYGGVDILVNNAQTIEYLLLNDSSDQVMADAFNTGPFAAFRFMRAAYPYLKARKGVIVNVGSSAIHLRNKTHYGAYTTAKAGIQALTRSAAVEWAEDGIRAFVIHPVAESVMTMQWKEREPESYAATVARLPKKRLGDPLEDIGRPLTRLILHADRYNGKTITITALGLSEVIDTIEDRPFPIP